MSHRQYVAGRVSPKGIKHVSITSATTLSTVSWTNYLRQESFLHIVCSVARQSFRNTKYYNKAQDWIIWVCTVRLTGKTGQNNVFSKI